jgi:hypothetical protein
MSFSEIVSDHGTPYEYINIVRHNHDSNKFHWYCKFCLKYSSFAFNLNATMLDLFQDWRSHLTLQHPEFYADLIAERLEQFIGSGGLNGVVDDGLFNDIIKVLRDIKYKHYDIGLNQPEKENPSPA